MIAAACHAVLFTSCNRDPLTESKKHIKEAYRDEQAYLLVPQNSIKRTIPASSGGPSDRVAVEGGGIILPKWNSIQDMKQGKEVKIGAISVFVVTKAHAPSFSKLPAIWGDDDIAKVLSVSRASAHDVDAAASTDDLKDVTARLAAKAIMVPPLADKGLTEIDTPTFTGLLSGGIETGRAELVLRPKSPPEIYYSMIFKGDGNAAAMDLERILSVMEFVPTP